MEGSLAFCAASDAGLDIIDLSDPANPALVSNTVLPGSAQAVAVSGSYAYVAYRRPSSNPGGIQILDISDPAEPSVVGTFEGSAGHVTALFVAGTHAYLGYRSTGLDIVDVSDPAAPTLATGFRGVDHVQNVYVAGNYAYLAARGEKLWILDVSDPSAPVPVYQYTVPAFVHDVFVSGSYAYLATNVRGLEILEVSNPAAPTFVTQFSGAGALNNLFVAGSKLYCVATDGAVRIIDVAVPAIPAVVGTYDDSVSGDVRLFVAGTDVYFADLNHSNLRLVDASLPASPALLGTWATPGVVHGVAVSGSHAFVATRHHGLAVVDISNPSAPELVTTHVPSSGTYYPEVTHLAVEGDVAYIASWKTLEILDVSIPATPSLLGNYTTTKTIDDLAVSGSYAYVVTYQGSLEIVDVSNPALAWKAGEYDPAGYPWGVFVAGGHAYLGCRSGWIEWLEIIDVSQPWAPSKINELPVGRPFVQGDYAYLTNNTLFRVYDVSDPASASLVGSCPCTNCGRPYVADGFAYLRARDPVGNYYHLQVIDASDVSAPLESGLYSTPGGAHRSAADPYRVYVADGTSGKLVIFRIESFLAVADASVVEGHSGPRTLSFDVTLTRPSDEVITAAYDTADGTATTAGNDYQVSSGTVVFAAGDTEEPVDVTILGDTDIEPDETLSLGLSAPVGALLLDDTATGTIVNDDPNCFRLTLSHLGAGADPAATPAADPGCPPDHYRPGTLVELLALADPAWKVASWTGTSDDASESSYNTLTMPANDHPASVTYVAGVPASLVLRNLEIDSTRLFEACVSILADAFAVVAPGDATLSAGDSLALGNGFFVEQDCNFTGQLQLAAGCSP